jgi:mannose-1-phosphate guanylyltransferase
MHLIILADDIGPKLWPVTSEALPKAFLPVYSEISLLEETIVRYHKLMGETGDRIVIVVQEKAVDVLLNRGILEKYAIPFGNVVVLPSSKGSAWAIWSACKYLLEVKRVKTTEQILICPSDQFFWPREMASFHFNNIISGSVDFVNQIMIACLPPGGPAPSMNYVQVDYKSKGTLGIPIEDTITGPLSTLSFTVSDYASTPDYETAKELVGDSWM